jgi:putative oxidoreductase
VTSFRGRELHRFVWTGRESKVGQWALLPIRIIVGYGFIAHGYSKLLGGPEHFAEILHVLGVPIPGFIAWITIVVELVGGLAVLLGVFVSLVSILFSAILLASVFKLLLPYGFLSIKLQGVTSTRVQLGTPGYEVDLLYLACLAALVLGGTGPLSLDQRIATFKNTRAIATRNKV